MLRKRTSRGTECFKEVQSGKKGKNKARTSLNGDQKKEALGIREGTSWNKRKNLRRNYWELILDWQTWKRFKDTWRSFRKERGRTQKNRRWNRQIGGKDEWKNNEN